MRDLIATPLAVSRSSTALLRALVHETARAPDGIARRGLSALRKARLLAGDPAVTARIGKRELVLPLSHDLPIHRARHPDYSLNLGRIAAALDEVGGGAPIVDIGANVGDSAAIIRDCVPDAPILCIEGDTQFLPYLRHNVRDLVGVDVVSRYVRYADRACRPTAVVRSGGTAQLIDQEGAIHADPVMTRALDTILCDHPRFAEPRMIKLDTDGHDADILLQAEKLLSASEPVVYFEFDPQMAANVGGTDPHAALDLLAGLGYRRALFFTNTGRFARALDVAEWASELPMMTAQVGPGRPVAYFDVCAFGSGDGGLADEVERRETNVA